MIRIILKILKVTKNAIAAFILCLLVVLAIPYGLCPIYDFPDPHPFHGDHWYNPYEDLDGIWLKANFHAHSRSWLGATDGRDPVEDVIEHYDRIGYDIISLSNYMSIARLDTLNANYIPVYEHGYNIGKTHQLAMGAERVVWADFVFGQNIHHKQNIIKRLNKHSESVVLAHPRMQNSYKGRELARLTDYHLFEVLNHYTNSEALWDTLLSSGRIAWILGNDDTHDISRPKETGRRWTLINALSPERDAVYKALRKGRTIGIDGWQGQIENRLTRLRVQNDTLNVECERPAKEIVFIGQHGRERFITTDTRIAKLPLRADDRYIRTRILGETTVMLLNPIIRYDGRHLPESSSRRNETRTWAKRIIYGFVIATGLVFGMKLSRRRRKRKMVPHS